MIYYSIELLLTYSHKMATRKKELIKNLTNYLFQY